MAERQKILITGGSGQIGDMITKNLKENHDIKIFDINEPKDHDVEFIRSDLRDLEKVKEASKGMDCIIHLAAYFREISIPTYPEGWEVNCTSTFNIFEAAVQNQVKKVIFASSICAVGIATWASSDHSLDYFPIDELHPCRPQDLYGTSKLIGENLAWMYAKKSDTSFLGLRMATVWFKSERGISPNTEMLINTYVKDPTMFFSAIPPTQKRRFALKDLTWQYVDSRDVVQAFRLCFEKRDIKYGIYNIGAEDTPSELDSLKLAQLFYPEVPIRNPMMFLVDKKRALWDISKAGKELGYKPRHHWKEYL
jgi:nucleoside-diphosphate-sugar epimerase